MGEREWLLKRDFDKIKRKGLFVNKIQFYHQIDLRIQTCNTVIYIFKGIVMQIV